MQERTAKIVFLSMAGVLAVFLFFWLLSLFEVLVISFQGSGG